jgi:hypothetical protein
MNNTELSAAKIAAFRKDLTTRAVTVPLCLSGKQP